MQAFCIFIVFKHHFANLNKKKVGNFLYVVKWRRLLRNASLSN